MKRVILLLNIIQIIVLVLYGVEGHVPSTPAAGENLETAVEIEVPQSLGLFIMNSIKERNPNTTSWF
jgi:hypothetical protein